MLCLYEHQCKQPLHISVLASSQPDAQPLPNDQIEAHPAAGGGARGVGLARRVALGGERRLGAREVFQVGVLRQVNLRALRSGICIRSMWLSGQ